ncbi:heterokaryon incompatibility protein-domain-containing protein, partial [Phaeosphaeriaceae sp. PMI808]
PSQYFNAPLHLSIHTAGLSNWPEYKALSYVWGSSEMTSTIHVNNIQCQATTNLVSALRHIREKQTTIILWVDALCINQEDTNERNQQVQMMARIYKSAQEVIAWLGKSE